VQGKVVDAIDITRTQGDGSQAAGCGFGSHHHDVRQMPFTVAHQVQRFGARILGAVAAYCPFAGNTGVQQRVAAILPAQAGKGKLARVVTRSSTKHPLALMASSVSSSRTTTMSGVMV